MTRHRTDRLRVAAPTLEPDPVLLALMAEASASSRPAAPRTARPAGLRLIVATASVAAIAAATWAAGIPIGTDIPLSPADAPTQEEPSGPPSPGNVGSPQPDVSDLPGSPVSPGLPGNTSSPSGRPADPPGLGPDGPGLHKGHDQGKGQDHAKSGSNGKGKAKGQGQGKRGAGSAGKGRGAENRSDNGRRGPSGAVRGPSGAMPPSSQGTPRNPQR